MTPSSTRIAVFSRSAAPVPSKSRAPVSQSRSAAGAGAAISAGNLMRHVVTTLSCLLTGTPDCCNALRAARSGWRAEAGGRRMTAGWRGGDGGCGTGRDGAGGGEGGCAVTLVHSGLLQNGGLLSGKVPRGYLEPPAAHRAAVVSQQAALRRPGRLRAPPEQGTLRARAPRRGVLRPAVPGTGPGPGAARGAQPGPVPRQRPVPHPALGRVPRLGGRAGDRDDVGRRLSRAADLQHPGAAGPGRTRRRTSTWCTTTRASATGCSACAGSDCRW